MILLIDNYDSFTFNLYQLISVLKEKVVVVRNDQITLEEIEEMDLDGIVLSPGPGRPEDAGICIDIIQKLGDKIPILGVCLGHQAIASGCGGTIIQASRMLHGKDSLVFHYRSDLFRGVHLPFRAGRYHSLAVQASDLPASLTIDAEDEEGTIMALSHRQFPLYGVQFHPESILTPEGTQIVQNFIDICHARRALCCANA